MKILLFFVFLLILTLLIQTSQASELSDYDKSWSIKIYYITQNNIYNNNYRSIIDNGMEKANQILKSYDDTSLQWTIEKVNVPSDISIGNDIFIEYSNESKVIRAIPGFKTQYNDYNITFFVIHNTTGGAYSVNYMSPIWFSWSAFEKDINSLGGMGIVHEFLHTFGLRDINEGQSGCIMGDLYISELNLCDQSYLFKPENYKKTPLSEWFNDTVPILIVTPTPTTTYITPSNGIFKILSETYIDNITDLPYSDGIPDKNIQSSGHIRGWIDIVGFRDVARLDGVDYLNANPTDKAIINYHVWYENLRPNRVVYLKDKTTVFQSPTNYTVCKLDIELKWYKVVCGETCRRIYTIEIATFYDYEPAPIKIEPLIEPEINIIQYNNTLYENIGIQIIPKDIETLSKFDITYNDSSITRTFKTGYVEKTEKGIYFANLTKMILWETTGKNIRRFNDQIFIDGNLSKINVTNIKISTSNLYETKYHTNYTISRVEFRPEKETIENPLLISFWSIIIVIFGGAYLTITKMRIL